jgi:hypothetical protein
MEAEDLVGLDRLACAFARQLARMQAPCMVAIHGAPGSAKREFLRRLTALVADSRSLALTPGRELFPDVIWFDAWAYSKQGNVLAGLVSRVARYGPGGTAMTERVRDVVAQLNRLDVTGASPDGPGPAFSEGELEPVERLQRGFAGLVQNVRSGRPGKLVVCVEGLDRLRPDVRWSVLDGIRLIIGDEAEVAVLVAIGGQAVAMAARYAEGDLPGASIDQVLSDLFDLSLTVPSLEVRRIGSMLQRHLGVDEALLRRAFGPDAVRGLAAAVAHRPLGSPRLVYRLVQRVLMLAEYAMESQHQRELTEAQWCWVIVSERWPAFRRFMIRGGRRRWAGLGMAVGALGTGGTTVSTAGEGDIGKMLKADPILADYLKRHADGFERDADGILWLENMLLAAGL